MLKRSARRARRIADLFPITPLGLAVGGASYGVLQHYGYKQRDLVLFAVSALGLLLVGVAIVVAALAALVVFRSARAAHGDGRLALECGRFAPTGFSIRALWFVPFATVAWTWSELRVEVRQQRLRGRLHETVRATRRGVAPRIRRRFEVGDVFGLARIQFEVAESRDVRLLPSVGALRQVHVIRGLSSGSDASASAGKPEGDPFDTRRYAPGDPIRFVLWKVFAKSRNLIVRTPERAESPVEHTVAYLVTGSSDEPAAGAARLALELGAFGNDWRIGADGMDAEARTRDGALDLVTRSASVSDSLAGTGLAHFVERAGALGRLVVFVPPRPGPWLPKVRAAVRELKGKVDFVVGTDGIARGSKVLRALSRAEPSGGGEQAVPIDELLKVVKALEGGTNGARVVVVDRRTGHAYLPEHLAGRKQAHTKVAS